MYIIHSKHLGTFMVDKRGEAGGVSIPIFYSPDAIEN